MRLLLPGCLRRVWCWRARLSGLPSHSEASSAAAWRLSWGHRHVSLRRLSEEFRLFLQLPLAWFALGNLVHYFIYVSYLAVTLLCLGVAFGVQVGFFGRSWYVTRAQILGSTVDTLGSTVDACSASVRGAFGRTAHNFYVNVNSNPEVFFSVLTQNGEVCSVDASGALKSGILCTSCTWLAVCTMKGLGVGAHHTGDELLSISLRDWRCMAPGCGHTLSDRHGH